MIERMKKQLLLVAVIGLLFVANTASAQTKIGAFLGYGSEIETLALGANAEFPIKDKLSIAPGLVFFLPNDESGYKVSMWELNGNVNYYFSEGSVNFYGLLGLNIAGVKVNYDDDLFDDQSDTELGVNMGVGANFDIGKNFMPFGEVKYAISDFDQLSIFFGLKFKM
jgi:outer membrane immunogenic protein